MENSRVEFHHSNASRFSLALVAAATGWATFVAANLNLEGVWKLTPVFPFLLFLFAAYRFYLTLRSVVVDDGRLTAILPGRRREFAIASIRNLRFDSYPNDLIVETLDRSVRLPRTLQGFQKLHELLIRETHLGLSESLPLEVRVRRSLRWVSLLAILVQAVIGALVARQGVTAFGTLFCVTLLVAAAVFLDQYLLRRCVFHADGVWVYGLFGGRFFPHSSLVDTEVKKTNLWTRMRLNFGAKSVTFEDQVLDLPVVRLARIVEHEWGHAVHGVNSPKAQD